MSEQANAAQLGDMSSVERAHLDAIAKTKLENTAKLGQCAEIEIKLRGARPAAPF